ncbi:MAG: hypothetical protein JWN85_959 [Gammaproteobacteria bacterium]|nr:hypothetical protein [Gammaproteobacteria bacterium]
MPATCTDRETIWAPQMTLAMEVIAKSLGADYGQPAVQTTGDL